MLEEGARLEGKVDWYTTLAGDVLDGVASAFQQKYPYIKVDVFRADTNALTTRLDEESKAKKYNADSIIVGQDQSLVLRDSLKVLQPYFTPAAKSLPADQRQPAKGELNYWVLDSGSYVGFAYNTNLLPQSDVPKSFKDLLNPALKGKMAVAGTSTGVNWAGNMLTNQNEAFATQVAKQQAIKIQQVSGKALLDLIASGEIIASPSIYLDHVEQAAAKGAPVKWVPLEPVTTGPYAVSVAVGSPHPHAALLFADLMAGADGEKVMGTFHYANTAIDPGFKRWYPAGGMTADEYQQKYSQWQDFFNKQFVQK